MRARFGSHALPGLGCAGTSCGATLAGLFPQSQKTMLQHWKLIQVAGGSIVQQALDQSRLDARARLSDRSFDHLCQLIARQGRNQKLASAYRLGQSIEARAFPNEI